MYPFIKKKYLLIFISITIISFFVVDNILVKEVSNLKENKYLEISNNLKNQVKNSIENKSISTMNIAIALSENYDLKQFLKNNKKLTTNFKNISSKIKEYSIYKNVWIQVINKKGISKYRSWSSKKDDDISKIRKELQILLKEPKVFRVVSVGIFDMTFKNIIPIYEKDEFLGFIEVITKMNSIAKEFKKENLELVILADKKFKNQIKKPFTKTFINDYYLANYNANENLKKLIEKDTNKYISIKDYLIENNYFITKYLLKDLEGKKLGYFIVFKDLNTIDLEDILGFENFVKVIGILIILILIIITILIYFYNKTKYTNLLEKNVIKRTKEIKELTKRYKQIFQESRAIKVIIDPETLSIVDINESALKFYGYSKEEFLKLKLNEINLIEEKTFKRNFKKILNSEKNIFIFKHKLSNGTIKDVEIYASPIEIDNKIYIYSIIRDITQDLKEKEELKDKEQLFYQQAKMASMGEMLENIAHQWRQPLSTISTAASGIKIKKEFDDLDDSFFFESIDLIVKSTKYLSSTIEDFRDFFKHSKNIEQFKLSEIINNVIKLSNIKQRAIDLEINCDDITIEAYKNELVQVLLNIINNSKFALDHKKVENKLIKIDVKKINKDYVSITILDNAGGIEENKVNKIFEPYFTTKHKSQGTGIGLYMSEQIITKHFNGEILALNKNFIYKNRNYFGASLEIKIPIKLDS